MLTFLGGCSTNPLDREQRHEWEPTDETRRQDRTRPSSKNGKDHIQDQGLRELSDQNQQHHDEFIAFTKQDLGSHQTLDKTIQGVKTTIDKYTFTGKVLWSIAGLLWTALVAAAGWMAAEVGADGRRDSGPGRNAVTHRSAGRGTQGRDRGTSSRTYEICGDWCRSIRSTSGNTGFQRSMSNGREL